MQEELLIMDKQFFDIRETNTKWIVKSSFAKLEAVFELPKESYPTEEDVRNYLQKEGLEG